MHILVTADTLGGVWTYTRELITGLVRRGERVTLVSFGNIPTPAQTRWMEALKNFDYRPTAFKLEWMLDSEADMAASAQYLQAVIEETRPDLLHLSQFYYGSLDCDLPRVVIAHSDVVSWWMSVHAKEPPETDWLRWYRRIVQRGLRQATAVIAPSQWMLEQVGRYYGTPAHGAVIYNGRTPTFFNPHVSKEEKIVTVGRLWDSGKNVSLLLQQEMPGEVHIVGSDRHPDFQSHAFAAEAIRPNVHLDPEQSETELAQTLSRAGIYVAASRYEPFGLAPVEAALSRCALVASDIPSFRELWDSSAVFFRDNDAASLQTAVTRLLCDRGLRREKANLAYHHAQRCFSAKRMVSDYMNLYRTLVPAQALSA
jgi:glycogen synthase